MIVANGGDRERPPISGPGQLRPGRDSRSCTLNEFFKLHLNRTLTVAELGEIYDSTYLEYCGNDRHALDIVCGGTNSDQRP